jgi:2-keto-4-pentenoate hydratase/2-oxohepta-3-ene-1,7-dioic acid hydratase in catechol pathway
MKIICVGRNYAAHAAELGNDKPKEPVIFLKPDTSLLKNNDPFYLPAFSNEIHHEIELLVKIKKEGKKIAQEYAHNYYDEIGLGIDFTARDLQSHLKKKGLPWEIAKAFDHSAVISHFIAKDSIDLANTSITLYKNEEIVQNGNTSNMLFSLDEIISYISTFFTLKTGDIIFTGTPSGVGPVAIGDRLRGTLDNQKMFEFDVK